MLERLLDVGRNTIEVLRDQPVLFVPGLVRVPLHGYSAGACCVRLSSVSPSCFKT